MFSILTLNQISVVGLDRFPRDGYELASSLATPDAILLRSHQLAEADIAASTLAIARAGAGVNNIPVKACRIQDQERRMDVCILYTGRPHDLHLLGERLLELALQER